MSWTARAKGPQCPSLPPEILADLLGGGSQRYRPSLGLQPSRVEDVVKRLLKEIPQETSPEPKRTSDPS